MATKTKDKPSLLLDQSGAPMRAAVPAKVEHREVSNAEPNVLDMIERLATDPRVDADKLDKMLAMQERVLDRQNKAAFDAALAEMQPRLPVIDRKGKIEVREKDARGERTGKITQSTKYAKYEDIVEAITPVLKEYGFGLRFKTGRTTEGLLIVTGILSGCGHREETEFILPFDTTGSKNNVQAIGSSTSYGKRMAACALLNIVSRGEDDDAFSSGGPAVIGDPLSEDQVTRLIEQCEAVECKRERFLKHMNNIRPKGHPEAKTINDLPVSRYDEAVLALQSYDAERRKREQAKVQR